MHLLEMEDDVLEKNKELADENKKLLKEKNIKSFNIMGAIGSGKTRLLERAIQELDINPGVIAGDVKSEFDGERFEKLGVPVAFASTGDECHLDAHLVEHSLEDLPLDDIDVVFIENVGNLVCPADFDLGEGKRVVVISTTEGSDTIAKHPVIFKISDVVVINKIDIADAVDVDVDEMVEDAKEINPNLKVLRTSAKTGEGLEDWYDLIKD